MGRRDNEEGGRVLKLRGCVVTCHSRNFVGTPPAAANLETNAWTDLDLPFTFSLNGYKVFFECFSLSPDLSVQKIPSSPPHSHMRSTYE